MDSPNLEIQIPELVCPSCHAPITADEYFCPTCGKKLKEKLLSTGIGKQSLMYLISFFLPPFGLPWAYKYFKQSDKKSKRIAYVILGLTVFSIIINVWLIIAFVNQINQTISSELNGSVNSLYSQ